MPTTQSSNRSLTSVPGTEFFDAETEGPDPPFCLAETDAGTRTNSKKPAVHGTNARITRGARYLKTGWWIAQSHANRSRPATPCYSLLFAFFQGRNPCLLAVGSGTLYVLRVNALCFSA